MPSYVDKRFGLLSDVHVLFRLKLFVEERKHLRDGVDYELQVKFLEWLSVAHILALLPVKENLPQPERSVVHVLNLFVVLGAG